MVDSGIASKCGYRWTRRALYFCAQAAIKESAKGNRGLIEERKWIAISAISLVIARLLVSCSE